MPVYSDWGTIPARHREEIARIRALEQATERIGTTEGFSEAALLDAAMAEAIGSVNGGGGEVTQSYVDDADDAVRAEFAAADTTEATTRAAAVTALQAADTAEAAARAAGDSSTLSNAQGYANTKATETLASATALVNAEAATRATADTTEQTARIAGDASTLSSANAYTDAAVAAIEISGGALAPGWYDIRSYGAVEGGYTSCVAAIHAAIAACPVGGTVFIPPGKWLIDTTLKINKSVNVVGVGVRSCLWTKMSGAQTKIGVVIGTELGVDTAGINWDETGIQVSECTFEKFSIQGSSDLAPIHSLAVFLACRCEFNLHVYGSSKNPVIVGGCLQSRFRLYGNLNGPSVVYQNTVIASGTVASVPADNNGINIATHISPATLTTNDPQYFRRLLRTSATSGGTPPTNGSRDIRVAATNWNTNSVIKSLGTWAAYGVAAPVAGSNWQIVDDGSWGWNGAFLLIKNLRTAPSGWTTAEWGYDTWSGGDGSPTPLPTNACYFDINAEGGTTTGGVYCEAQPNQGGNNYFTGCVQGFENASGSTVLGAGYGLYIEDSIGFHIYDWHQENTLYGCKLKHVSGLRRFSIDNSLFAPNNGAGANSEEVIVDAPTATDFGYSIRNSEIGKFTRIGHTSSSYTLDKNIIGATV